MHVLFACEQIHTSTSGPACILPGLPAERKRVSMRALTGLLRTNQALGGLAARAYGSVVATESGSPFLKYASPVPTATDYSPVLSTLPEAQVTTLPNGLRVATETTPFAETATLGLWISSGSRFETDATNGVANFLEHVLFKGTKKHSAKDLGAALDGIGAKLSASTGREQTTFCASGILAKDAAKGVDLLGDILLNPKLDDADISAARSTILSKLAEGDKVSQQLVFDHLHATAFQHSPLGRTVAGPAENIKAFGKQDLVDYMKTHFRGPRMVLVGTGAISHDELVKKASEVFGSVADEEPSTSVRSMVQKEPALYTGSYVHDRFPFATECAMAVGFKGAAATDADSIPLAVVQTLLGSWDKKVGGVGNHSGSRLVQTVTAEDLADSLTAYNTSYHDAGLFGVYGVTDRDRCEDFAYHAMLTMTKMCYEVSEMDVLRAKAQLKNSILLSQGSASGLAQSIGNDLLMYGRRIPRAELFARIDAVDASTVQAVADRFIYDQDMVVSSVGDVQFMPDYNWFRRRSYLLRY